MGYEENVINEIQEKLDSPPESSQNNSKISLGDRTSISGDVFTGDKINLAINVESSIEELIAGYYLAIASECNGLPIGIIDTNTVNVSFEQPINLTDVYVELDAYQIEQVETDTSSRGLREEAGKSLPVYKILENSKQKKIILLGEAGSGKTTFVNYLGFTISATLAGRLENQNIPPVLRNKFLFRSLLRDVASNKLNAINTGSASIIWNALYDDIAEKLGKIVAEKLFTHLQSKIIRDGCVMLLDGLDEVPQAQKNRKIIIDSINDFVNQLPTDKTIVLITARPYVYKNPEWRFPNFTTYYIKKFDSGKIDAFIDKWYRIFQKLMGLSDNTTNLKLKSLKETIKTSQALTDLSQRPILLTLIVTLHSSWGKLPEDRADLYEEAIRLLISRWQLARETDDVIQSADGDTIFKLGVKIDKLREVVDKLAYQVHYKQKNRLVDPDTPSDIDEVDLIMSMRPLLGDVPPDKIIDYLKDRAGLIVERGINIYAFPHRSFQEYLAACYLVNHPEFLEKISQLLTDDFDWWREVFILAIGKAKRGGISNAVSIIQSLMVVTLPANVNEYKDIHWKLVPLFGEALLSLHLEDREDAVFFSKIMSNIRDLLLNMISGDFISIPERQKTGDILGRLRDPRSGVSIQSNGYPDITWVEIPQGDFIMGSKQEDEKASNDEFPIHKVLLSSYYISRYPITNSQYKAFIDDHGYDDEKYWTKLGWAWRQGQTCDLSIIQDPEILARYHDWFNQRSLEKRSRPFWFDDPKWGAPNRPVVGVCWHEAIAFTKWFNEKLKQEKRILVLGQNPHEIIPEYVIRLPSEAEWEKAARGVEGAKYPWGEKWIEDYANTAETGLGETSPVGIFPGGGSPFGVLDMAGNVYEWTQSIWGHTSTDIPDYAYPYYANDGREQIEAGGLRVLRGGAWFYKNYHARCANRYWEPPDDYFERYGFRIVLGPQIS